ncbi:MAG: hypothetical protein ACTSRZ_05750 [Promethearchaeota archaeon]
MVNLNNYLKEVKQFKRKILNVKNPEIKKRIVKIIEDIFRDSWYKLPLNPKNKWVEVLEDLINNALINNRILDRFKQGRINRNELNNLKNRLKSEVLDLFLNNNKNYIKQFIEIFICLNKNIFRE